MATGPQPGERYVDSRGKHAGAEVEVVDVTNLGNVKVRPVGGSGVSWSSSKSEAAGYWIINRGLFDSRYVSRESFVPGEAHGGGRAFRQRNPKKPQAQVDMANLAALHAPPPNGQASIYNPTNLSIEVVDITPDLARAWLDRPTTNRNLTERRVAVLVEEIRRGRWQTTGDSIKLFEDGGVGDGQHRLEAIARSGMTCRSLVVRNIDRPAFDVIDTGRPRQPSDVLAIHGYLNVRKLAAVARGLLLIEAAGRYDPQLRNHPDLVPTTLAIKAYVDQHNDELQIGIHLASKLNYAKFVGGHGLWAIPLVMFWRLDPRATEFFVERLVEGDNLEKDSPILKLRNMFRGNRDNWTPSQGNREKLLALAIKAWNYWRRGESIKLLRWADSGAAAEAFPVAE